MNYSLGTEDLRPLLEGELAAMSERSSAAQSLADWDSHKLVEQQLDDRVDALENHLKADCLAYLGPIHTLVVDEIKDAIEMREDRRRKLVVLLETTGGFMSAAEQFARIFRHHYRRVEFLIPSYAMSAGTVLVMSGDAIHMDYAAVLGPIDPQIARGRDLVPALGYVEKYKELIERAEAGDITTAEVTYLVQSFNPAELYRYEQECELSEAVLEEWLTKYKFKNWKTTETRGAKVTQAMRKERAREIASQLNDNKKWHSHNRGIPADVLRRDLKLLIDDFGADPELNRIVRDYYRLLKDHRMRRSHGALVLHRKGKYVGI